VPSNGAFIKGDIRWRGDRVHASQKVEFTTTLAMLESGGYTIEAFVQYPNLELRDFPFTMDAVSEHFYIEQNGRSGTRNRGEDDWVGEFASMRLPASASEIANTSDTPVVLIIQDPGDLEELKRAWLLPEDYGFWNHVRTVGNDRGFAEGRIFLLVVDRRRPTTGYSLNSGSIENYSVGSGSWASEYPYVAAFVYGAQPPRSGWEVEARETSPYFVVPIERGTFGPNGEFAVSFSRTPTPSRTFALHLDRTTKRVTVADDLAGGENTSVVEGTDVIRIALPGLTVPNP